MWGICPCKKNDRELQFHSYQNMPFVEHPRKKLQAHPVFWCYETHLHTKATHNSIFIPWMRPGRNGYSFLTVVGRKHRPAGIGSTIRQSLSTRNFPCQAEAQVEVVEVAEARAVAEDAKGDTATPGVVVQTTAPRHAEVVP
jgi:hypothetical protein